MYYVYYVFQGASHYYANQNMFDYWLAGNRYDGNILTKAYAVNEGNVGTVIFCYVHIFMDTHNRNIIIKQMKISI